VRKTAGREREFCMSHLPRLRALLLALCLPTLIAYGQDTRRNEVMPIEELQQLAYAFALIKADYVSVESSKKLVEAAISGMATSLDPHSRYLDRTALAQQTEELTGNFVGVGIEAEDADGVIRVISAIEGSPAFRAGIQPRDVIVSVNGVAIGAMTLNQLARQIRGVVNTSVTLSITRAGVGMPMRFTLVRQAVKVDSIKSRIVSPGVAWVRITGFQERTVPDLVATLRELDHAATRPSALILDLRSDPGGLVAGAVGVAAAFLPKDSVVVSIKGRMPGWNRTLTASPAFYGTPDGIDVLATSPGFAKTVPMVVLIDAGSASAAEIVAAALQDHHRATLIGVRSFGKGSIQEIRPLSRDTAISLTVARYYTPSGQSIQARGITPDIASAAVPGAQDATREADLENHLPRAGVEAPASVVAPATRSPKSPAATGTTTPASSPPEFGSAADTALAQAIRHLQASAKVATRAIGSP
jgi:carboxyl-terminal processing protease